MYSLTLLPVAHGGGVCSLAVVLPESKMVGNAAHILLMDKALNGVTSRRVAVKDAIMIFMRGAAIHDLKIVAYRTLFSVHILLSAGCASHSCPSTDVTPLERRIIAREGAGIRQLAATPTEEAGINTAGTSPHP